MWPLIFITKWRAELLKDLQDDNHFKIYQQKQIQL